MPSAWQTHSEHLWTGPPLPNAVPLKVDELDWMTSFKYECLKNQITIRGVYIKGYATGGWEDYDLPEGAGFCVAIQDWLEARSQSVLAGESKSSNGSCE